MLAVPLINHIKLGMFRAAIATMYLSKNDCDNVRQYYCITLMSKYQEKCCKIYSTLGLSVVIFTTFSTHLFYFLQHPSKSMWPCCKIYNVLSWILARNQACPEGGTYSVYRLRRQAGQRD